MRIRLQIKMNFHSILLTKHINILLTKRIKKNYQHQIFIRQFVRKKSSHLKIKLQVIKIKKDKITSGSV